MHNDQRFLPFYYHHLFFKSLFLSSILAYYVYNTPQGEEEGPPLDSYRSAAGESQQTVLP
jgi:hypothetical protein